MRIRILVVGAVAALLALSGCGSVPTPTSTPTSADPTPTPTSTPAADPEPRFGDGCAALVPTSLIDAIFESTPVSARDFLETEAAAQTGIPRHAAVAQDGGMLCEWSNGVAYSSQTGASGFRGMQLSVLADAADGWDRMTEYYGLDPEAGGVFCNERVCGIDVFAGGYWFSAEIAHESGSDPLAAVQTLADTLRAAGISFGAPDPAIAAPSPTVADDCEVAFPIEVVDAAFGVGHGLFPTDAGGGWSLWAEAALRTGGFGCGWYDEGSRYIAFDRLDGGAWLAADLGVAAGGTPVAVTGLDAGESVSITCDGFCDLSLVVGGHWFSVIVEGAPDNTVAATVLAQHIVDLLAAA